jgi:hypothetical protein
MTTTEPELDASSGAVCDLHSWEGGAGSCPDCVVLSATRSDLIPVRNLVARSLLLRHAPDLVRDDELAPIWAVVAVDAFRCAAHLHGIGTEWIAGTFAWLSSQIDCQDAVVSGHRLGAKGYEIIEMIDTWRNQE